MNKNTRYSLVAVLSLASSFLMAQRPLAADLTYVAVQPCRIVDTREFLPNGGGIPRATSEDFVAFGTDVDIDAQGGNPDGCQHPKAAQGKRPVAIAANITVTPGASPSSTFITVYPAGTTRPLASTLNFQAGGQNIANSTIVTLCTGVCSADFTVYVQETIPVIVDVQGYFYELPSGVARVAIDGGDYPNTKAALDDLANWCGVPASNNQCLIEVGPGLFVNEGFASTEMVSYVSIKGAGINETALYSQSSGATVLAEDVFSSTLSDLSIVNRGLGANSTPKALEIKATSNTATTLRVENVLAWAAGGTSSTTGIRISNPGLSQSFGPQLERTTGQVRSIGFASSNPVGIHITGTSDDTTSLRHVVGTSVISNGIGGRIDPMVFNVPIKYSEFYGNTTSLQVSGGVTGTFQHGVVGNGGVNDTSSPNFTCLLVTDESDALDASCDAP